MQNTNQPRGALQMPSGLTLPEKVIEHIAVTDSALQKAAAAEKQAATVREKVAAVVPQVVNALLQHGCIHDNQREKLAAMLQDPVTVLELMIKVAAHRNPDGFSRLGQGTPDGQTKAASANPASSLTNPYVGQRNAMVKQSSVMLFQGLGLTAPTQG